MRGWQLCVDVVPEVVTFPVMPARYWHVAPAAGSDGLYRGVLVYDAWEDDFDRTGTTAGPLPVVLAMLKQHDWRQGLPIVVEVPA